MILISSSARPLSSHEATRSFHRYGLPIDRCYARADPTPDSPHSILTRIPPPNVAIALSELIGDKNVTSVENMIRKFGKSERGATCS